MIPYFAVVAGVCAAFASVTGKIATGPPDFFPHRLLCWFLQQTPELEKPCTGNVLTFSRILWCLVCVPSNVLMWLALTKSLQKSTSSEALVVNMATNFCLSALIGVVFFGESLSLLWGFGVTLIVCGMAVMQKGKPDEKKN
jgi:drug/metabolite transporter (DMT)-like permease